MSETPKVDLALSHTGARFSDVVIRLERMIQLGRDFEVCLTDARALLDDFRTFFSSPKTMEQLRILRRVDAMLERIDSINVR